MGLDSAIYVSSPSSLYTYGIATALVKTTTVPISSVKEGRIDTYVRSNRVNQAAMIIFRYQDASNFYYAYFYWTPTAGTVTFEIHRVYGGVDTTLQTGNVTGLNINEWIRIRVTWWNDYVGLVIRFEYWNGSTWVIGCNDAYDSNNYWKDVGGRVGLKLLYYELGYKVWADDTYIYGIG